MISNSPWMCCASKRITHTMTNTHTYQMGTYIKGHFTFPAFSLSLSFALFRPSASPSPQLPQSLFLSLFLSVKVMQLIFLCLFIFQDWLWNVGSRQKPLRPPLSSIPSALLHLPSLSAGARPSKKPLGQEGIWRNAALLCPFPFSPASSPFQPRLGPHSTNGIKVMHHT